MAETEMEAQKVAMKAKLSATEKARIEQNRQKALLLRRAKLVAHPYAKIDTNIQEKSIIKVQGSRFVDSGGGFLVEEPLAAGSSKDADNKKSTEIETVNEAILIPITFEECLECGDDFADSYLFNNFKYAACDKCRDNDDKHALITKTEAKAEYLLKDCDFDRREPPLKFISRKNPHKMGGEMKLYLQLQVAERALEVWGTEEEIDKRHEERVEKRELSKIKKYSKEIRKLRMDVRSSLYTKVIAANHTHEFGPETYNEEDDNYSHTCTTCQFEETFEKM